MPAAGVVAARATMDKALGAGGAAIGSGDGFESVVALMRSRRRGCVTVDAMLDMALVAGGARVDAGSGIDSVERAAVVETA